VGGGEKEKAKGLTSSILLLSISSVENDVQINQIQLGKGSVGPRLDSSIEIRRHFLFISLIYGGGGKSSAGQMVVEVLGS